MTRYHAAWIVPISGPPIRDGWVDVDGGVIVAVGGERGSARGDEVDCGRSVILPGLVNAHTHLEFSGLRGKVPPAPDMPSWARRLMSGAAEDPPTAPSIRRAIEEARRAGTALVGETTNTRATVDALREGAMPAVVFEEQLGFDEHEPGRRIQQLGQALAGRSTERVRLRFAAHAPYSVSPEIFTALRNVAAELRLWPLSVHAAESREELEFLETGAGPWRAVLDERGRWDGVWRPPRVGPVPYLAGLGWLGPQTLLIHGVQMTTGDLDTVARNGAVIVTCPRSNQWTGAGIPPIEQFYRSGARIAVGTDSLASVDDLNMFSELREIRRLAPSVAASDILRSGTYVGAGALGFGGRLGEIAPGTWASMIAVAGVGMTDDVEEYLVSGIHPDQVSWVGSG